MKIQSYEDMTVELLDATEHPRARVALAVGITMRSNDQELMAPASSKLCKFLIDAEHSSILEHVHYTFLIQGMSRSLLAQITRQRSAHPTSGSQHYQDYSDYPMVAHESLTSGHNIMPEFESSLAKSLNSYSSMLDHGVPKEEARQVLPNACAVNYLWTIDARNLMFFLKQRLCNRNVTEMKIFSRKVLSLVREHFPELFDHVGPQCYMEKDYAQAGKACRQGHLQCEERGWKNLTS